MKCVFRVKTYLRSTTTKEFVVDSNATKYNLESSAQLTSEAVCQVARKVPRLQQSKSHASKLGKLAMLLTKYSCVAVYFQLACLKYIWIYKFPISPADLQP